MSSIGTIIAVIVTQLLLFPASATSQPAAQGRVLGCHAGGGSPIGPCEGDSEDSDPQLFSPLLPDFTRAQDAVGNSLRNYSNRSGTIIATITQYLLGQMPKANPTTLNELDEAAEDLAQFFEGYRQAYKRAADQVLVAGMELVENRAKIAKLREEASDYRKATLSWTLQGGPELTKRFKILATLSDLDRDSLTVATALLKRIDRSAHRDHRVWQSAGSISDIIGELQQRTSGYGRIYERRDRDREQSRRILAQFGEVRATLEEALPSVPARSSFSHKFSPVRLKKSNLPTADARIRENLGFVNESGLIKTISQYIDSTVDDPAQLLYRHAVSQEELVEARNAKRVEQAKSDRLPDVADVSSLIKRMQRDTLDTAVRWVFWKHLERTVAPFLQDTISSPQMLIRFAKVQEQVVRLANEDMSYLPMVARALATGSPEDIEYVKKTMDDVFCKYSAAFTTTAWPLPTSFNAGPFSAWIKTPDKLACQ